MTGVPVITGRRGMSLDLRILVDCVRDTRRMKCNEDIGGKLKNRGES